MCLAIIHPRGHSSTYVISNFLRKISISSILFLCLCGISWADNNDTNTASKTDTYNDTHTSIYLVRHFEKQAPNLETGNDVALTDLGEENAQKLANWLSEAQLQHLFTTDYKRTRQSIAPVQDLTQLVLQIYQPQNLSTLAQSLMLLDGNALVLGHSNTTGVLYGLLGCQEVLLSESEYGDIFKVSFLATKPQVLCERFHLNNLKQSN